MGFPETGMHLMLLACSLRSPVSYFSINVVVSSFLVCLDLGYGYEVCLPSLKLFFSRRVWSLN